MTHPLTDFSAQIQKGPTTVIPRILSMLYMAGVFLAACGCAQMPSKQTPDMPAESLSDIPLYEESATAYQPSGTSPATRTPKGLEESSGAAIAESTSELKTDIAGGRLSTLTIQDPKPRKKDLPELTLSPVEQAPLPDLRVPALE